MQRFTAALGTLAVLCLGAANALAGTAQNAPPIDPATLAGYGRGVSTISGHAPAHKGGFAFCAPYIPYVIWVAKHGLQSQAYDQRLEPYTQGVPIDAGGNFTCTGLSPGRYVVWAQSFHPVHLIHWPGAFSSWAAESINGNASGKPPEVDNNSGELLPQYGHSVPVIVSSASSHSGSAGPGWEIWLSAPHEVVVTANAVDVRL